MAARQSSRDPALVAKLAVQALGRGYDVTSDTRLKEDTGPCLIELDDNRTQELVVPGGIVLPNVPAAVKCDKGDRTRFTSDILSFSEMSEQFNQTLSISGKIPLGLFNNMFGFTGSWQKDASTTKSLALDGVFINLYTVELPRTQLSLKEEVRAAVPSAWDPTALASFVEKYGTHIIVGVKIGGKDIIYLKQQRSSTLSPVGVQKILAKKAQERFPPFEGRVSRESKGKAHEGLLFAPPVPGGPNGMSISTQYGGLKIGESFPWINDSLNNQVTLDGEGVTLIYKRKGGKESCQSHDDWLHTVQLFPDVISMSFVPITSLLNGVSGTGFLSHAINLYLRYKPPIQDLHYFLEFQLPKEWAPAFGDLPLGPPRKQQGSPSLQFRLMGPKLQVNTVPVIIGKRPVTGIRLYLEGKKSNRLAIHLQHLSVSPKILQPLWEDYVGSQEEWEGLEEDFSRYFEPVMWKSFSHVCTAPVENNETWVGGPAGAFVVVGAQLQVKEHGTKKVLFLELLYSRIPKAKIRRSEWDHMPASQQKSGIFSTLMSTTFSSSQPPPTKPAQVVINSAIYPEGPPIPGQLPKLLKFVDTTEMTRGPHDLPGHWLVTGAKLFLDRGKISVRVKYSILIYTLD